MPAGQIITIEGMSDLGELVWIGKFEIANWLYSLGLISASPTGVEVLNGFRTWWLRDSSRGPFPAEWVESEEGPGGQLQLEDSIASQLEADAAGSSSSKEKINWPVIVGVTAGVGLMFLFTVMMKGKPKKALADFEDDD